MTYSALPEQSQPITDAVSASSGSVLLKHRPVLESPGLHPRCIFGRCRLGALCHTKSSCAGSLSRVKWSRTGHRSTICPGFPGTIYLSRLITGLLPWGTSISPRLLRLRSSLRFWSRSWEPRSRVVICRSSCSWRQMILRADTGCSPRFSSADLAPAAILVRCEITWPPVLHPILM